MRAANRAKLEPGDEPTRASLLTSAQIQALLLRELAAGPLHKWELRDRLHLNEVRILRELQALRDEGKVRIVGKKTDQRQWALYSYAPPFMRSTPIKGATPPKVEPPSDSWWLPAQDGTQDDFYAAAKQRDRAMSSQPAWRQSSLGMLRR